ASPPRRGRSRRGGESGSRGYVRTPRGRPRRSHREDRSDLDGPVARGGNARRDRDRLVAVLRLDEVIATELLLGLRERPVGGEGLAVAHADGGRGRGALQPLAAEEVAAPLDRFGEGAELLQERAHLLLRALRPLRLVAVDQQDIFHRRGLL